MKRRLAQLASGKWTPQRALKSEDRARLTGMANQALATGGSPESAVGVFFVPGRVEILGKHTDYAGGRSLVVASEQGIWMLVCPRADRQLRIMDLARKRSLDCDIGEPDGLHPGDWTIYPRTVARRVDQVCDGRTQGAEVYFASTLVSAAGMSSSSALVIATFLALSWRNKLLRYPRMTRDMASKEDLAAFLGAVENGRAWGRFGGGTGVGTRGGDQDHTSILCAGRAEIRQYRFLPTVHERTLAMPPDFVFAIGASGVKAKKTGDAKNDYNRLSKQAGRLEQLWEPKLDRGPCTLGSIIREAPGNAERLSASLVSSVKDLDERKALQARLRQFQRETEEIIPQAADALEQQDLQNFGQWVDRSMILATTNLGNQIDETLCLVSVARDLGAVAASAFGAGFGGAVWAMVPRRQVVSFLNRWSEGYLEHFPVHDSAARFLWTEAGGPATEL